MTEEGEPDLKLDGFSLWVLGREFPANDDYWDGNWLRVKARMRAKGAAVEVEGPILRIPDLIELRDQLLKLQETLQGTAELSPLEPELHVLMTGQGLGHIAVRVSITPDQMTQTHAFEVETDQSYLPPFVDSLDRLLSDYTVRGEPET